MIDNDPTEFDTQLLRMPDVLQMTKLSEATIRRLITKKQFPRPIRLGSSILFRQSEVRAHIEKLSANR